MPFGVSALFSPEPSLDRCFRTEVVDDQHRLLINLIRLLLVPHKRGNKLAGLEVGELPCKSDEVGQGRLDQLGGEAVHEVWPRASLVPEDFHRLLHLLQLQMVLQHDLIVALLLRIKEHNIDIAVTGDQVKDSVLVQNILARLNLQEALKLVGQGLVLGALGLALLLQMVKERRGGKC